MHTEVEIGLTIFSSISIGTCFILTFYFFLIKKENRVHNFSLGLLFLAIALRLSKSVIFFIFSDIDTLGVALGFLGFTSIGPLMLLYFKNSVEKYNFVKPLYFSHFLYPVIGFTTIMLISGYDGILYLSALLSLVAYTLAIAIKFMYPGKHRAFLTQWHYVLFYAITGLICAFAFQHWGGSMKTYVIGTAAAALIIYVILFYALKSPTLIKKTKTIRPSKEQIDKVIEAIEVDKVYTTPAINLMQFSKVVDIPSYIISKVTKDSYNKTFPETINSFRIKEIKEKLTDPRYVNSKIESLAFEVGFNTPSAFYTAFKKETQKTPREYQKMIGG